MPRSTQRLEGKARSKQPALPVPRCQPRFPPRSQHACTSIATAGCVAAHTIKTSLSSAAAAGRQIREAMTIGKMADVDRSRSPLELAVDRGCPGYDSEVRDRAPWHPTFPHLPSPLSSVLTHRSVSASASTAPSRASGPFRSHSAVRPPPATATPAGRLDTGSALDNPQTVSSNARQRYRPHRIRARFSSHSRLTSAWSIGG